MKLNLKKRIFPFASKIQKENNFRTFIIRSNINLPIFCLITCSLHPKHFPKYFSTAK